MGVGIGLRRFILPHDLAGGAHGHHAAAYIHFPVGGNSPPMFCHLSRYFSSRALRALIVDHFIRLHAPLYAIPMPAFPLLLDIDNQALTELRLFATVMLPDMTSKLYRFRFA